MSYNLEVDGFETECCVSDNEINFNIRKKDVVEKVSLNTVDIIGIEDGTTQKSASNVKLTSIIQLYFIQKNKSPKWTKGTYRFRGNQDVCTAFISDVKKKLESVEQRPRRLLVIVNPISGKKNGRSVHTKIVDPLFKLANITTDVIFTERPNHITDILSTYDFATIDGIVLVGGDGGFQESINTLLKIAQNENGIDYNNLEVKLEPIKMPIGLIPAGTGNGVANFYYGCTDYVTAALHIIRGQRVKKTLAGAYCDGKLVSYFALVFGYGLFSDMMNQMDHQRWLGRARYLFGVVNFFFLKRQRLFDAEIICSLSHIEALSLNGGESRIASTATGLREIKQRHQVSVKENTTSDATLSGTPSSQQNQLSSVEPMLSEQKHSQQSVSSGDEEISETIEGRFMNIGMWMPDFTDDNFRFLPNVRREDRCTLTVFKPCSRLQNLAYMKDFATQNPEAFIKDFLLNYKVTRWKLRIKNETRPEVDFLNRLLDLDGEIFEIPKAEFEVRLLFEASTLFCSPE